MSQTYNIYCDESCHLEKDHQQAMVLGATWCPLTLVPSITQRLREIKARHGVNPLMEVKWTKVSPSKIQLYVDLVDYFFDVEDLHFRAVIVPDKSILDHAAHNQTHDDWYYKMYFEMLSVVLTPSERFRIYMDIKDTWSGRRANKLWEVLRNSRYDFSGQIVERVQVIRSEQVELMQLTDLLIGALSYVNNGRSSSQAKLSLIDRIRKRSGYRLTRTTLLRETKFNVLWWRSGDAK